MEKLIYFEQLESTQEYLKNLLKDSESTNNQGIIVSCRNQTKGIGRSSNTWEKLSTGLSFSFTSKLCDVPTLTSLEVGVLVAQFFKDNFNKGLKLKWPNDIFYQDKKIGGIIIHSSPESVVIGIGVNLVPSKSYHGLMKQVPTSYPEISITQKLVEFIESNRLSSTQILERWNQLCVHLNKEIEIVDDNKISGIFKGIGENGEALVDIDNKVEKFFTGTLNII